MKNARSMIVLAMLGMSAVVVALPAATADHDTDRCDSSGPVNYRVKVSYQIDYEHIFGSKVSTYGTCVDPDF